MDLFMPEQVLSTILPVLKKDLKPQKKIISAGYPTGFIVAPIMTYEGWREQYTELFDKLKSSIGNLRSIEPITSMKTFKVQGRNTLHEAFSFHNLLKRPCGYGCPLGYLIFIIHLTRVSHTDNK